MIYGREKMMEKMRKLKGGGEMIEEVKEEKVK